jgi:hypothetical protein
LSNSTSEWLAELSSAYEQYVESGWAFAQQLAAGAGRTREERVWAYELAAAQLGISPKTVANYANTARSPVAHIAQELGLELGHGRAVLGLDSEIAGELLHMAGEAGWEPGQLANYAHRRRSVTTARV